MTFILTFMSFYLMDLKVIARLDLYKSLHDNKYTYPNFNALPKALEKFEIICPKHGSFTKDHQTHGNRKNPKGCPRCSSKSIPFTYTTWVEAMNKRHGNYYNYGVFEYVSGQKSFAPVECPLHGWFTIQCHAHAVGTGCPSCRYLKVGQKNRKTKEDFVKQASLIHDDKYDYSEFIYLNNKTKSTISCKTCSFKWQARPDNHLGDQNGCPKCAKTGIYGKALNKDLSYSDMDCILYFIHIYNEDESFLKVGLTAESIKRRFSKLTYSFEVIDYFKLKLDKATVIESTCLQQFKDFKYKPNKDFSGKTECFTVACKKDIQQYLNDICVVP